MGKIKNYIKRLLYAIPFGLKGANKEIMGGNEQDANDTSINQEISDERVAKHLLKGEITQEVEELRYRTYLVDDESKEYDYVGNGVAVKKERDSKTDLKKRKFKQENNLICESMVNGIKTFDTSMFDRHRLEIDYQSFVRFKLEEFATQIDVEIDEDNNIIATVLHFSAFPNPYDAKSKPFINELERLFNAKNEYEVKHHEIASEVANISFTTYHANNEDDFVNYSFMDGAHYKWIHKDGTEYTVCYDWDSYVRLPLNLPAKYFSKTMDEKYRTHAPKNPTVELKSMERKRYCSVCGKEMSVYDADIMEASGMPVICNECLKKVKKNNQGT